MESRKKIRILYSIIAVLVLILGGIVGRSIMFRLSSRRDPADIINGLYYRIKRSIQENMNEDNGAIVFLGDSITDYANFGELIDARIRNRGIAGDTTLGVLDRLDGIIRMKPAKLFVLIGTNDIFFGRKSDEIVQSIRQIISRVQTESPGTKIYLQSLFPTNNIKFETNRPIETIQAVNAGLRLLADETDCTFIDLYPLLLNEGENALDLQYTLDGLHLNGAGVLKWVDLLRPYVIK